MELDPKQKNLLRFRAFAYLRQKQWKKAIEDYNVVVKENPKDLEALERRAYVLQQADNYNAAIADYTTLIQSRSKGAELYRRRGTLYRLSKNYEKAAADFRKVLELKPNDADAAGRLRYAEAKIRKPPSPPAHGTPFPRPNRKHPPQESPTPSR